MPVAELVLVVANAVYGTSYLVTRLVLDDIPPATLALLRAAGSAAILVPIAVRSRGPHPLPLSRADRWSILWMGVLGFAGAFAFFHWGLARSTTTNAALLVTVEPVALVLLAPVLLGERLSRREAAGATLAVAGATLVVMNGVPGLTEAVAPHWQGDGLLVLAGLAYASYSLLGRDVLRRHPALPVTAWSLLPGALALLPLAGLEWWQGVRPLWRLSSLAGTAYLTVVITALGYLAWNWALARVPAPRVAVFLNVQPLVGAVLGVWWLGEPLTVFTVTGGALTLAGLALAVPRFANEPDPGSLRGSNGAG